MPSHSRPANDIRRGYAALWALGLIVLAASVTAFAESYNGLRKWAEQHRVTGIWADIWPLQVDAFIAAGELTLLLSALYMWPFRVRILAWTVSLTGLAVSVVCNAGHVGHRASVADHLTAALPPVAAIAGLVIALSVIKQVTQMNPHNERLLARTVTPEAIPAGQPASASVPASVPASVSPPEPAVEAAESATSAELVAIGAPAASMAMTAADAPVYATAPDGAYATATAMVEDSFVAAAAPEPEVVGARQADSLDGPRPANGAVTDRYSDSLRQRYEELFGQS
jgi:hypothetical protein